MIERRVRHTTRGGHGPSAVAATSSRRASRADMGGIIRNEPEQLEQAPRAHTPIALAPLAIVGWATCSSGRIDPAKKREECDGVCPLLT